MAACPRDEVTTVADVGFETQIVLWTLRTLAHDRAGMTRVRGQFRQALRPAAARLAFGSAVRLHALLSRTGFPEEGLSGHFSPELSRLERQLAGLCQAINSRDHSRIAEQSANLVHADATPDLLDAIITLMAALQHRRRHSAPADVAGATTLTLH